MASKWDFVRLVMYWNKVGYGVSNGESLRELVSTEYCYTSISAISISLMLFVLISELDIT